jgi:DNA-binding transcriptional regulator GbsR (MarR family)
MATELTKVRENLSQSLGQLAEFAGFNRTLGQIYALLYLNSSALSLGEIAEELGVSKGNVSLNTRLMERWGLIKQVNRAADRRDYYEVEIDFWKVIQGILQGRERKKINDIGNLLAKSLKDVEKMKGSEADKDAQFYRERLQHMLEFYELFDQLFSALLALDDFASNSSLQPDPDREKKKELIDEEGFNLYQQRDYDPFYSDAFYIPVAALN